MGFQTYSVLFYINAGRAKSNSSGTTTINARVTVNGDFFVFSTHIKVRPEMWLAAKGRTHGRGREAAEINLQLDDILSRLNNIYHNEVTNNNYVSSDIVKDLFFGNPARKNTLLSSFDSYNENRAVMVGTSIVRATYLRGTRCRYLLASFLNEKYGKSDIALQDIDPTFVRDFDIYLRTVCRLGNNMAVKHIKTLKHIIREAIDAGYIQKNPFAGFKIRITQADRGFLTMNELQRLMNKDLSCKRLETVRDMFLFACYTGFAYVDVSQLTADNIQLDDNGNLWIVKRRQKTNVESDVMLLDIPKAIIEKYRGTTSDGRLFPIPSNQKTNAYLKELGDICGIEKKMTFHLARHTFATTITLANGVPIETVSKMLGHTNIKTTQIYARITKSKISSDMQSLAQKINDKNLSNSNNNHYNNITL